MWCPVGKEEVTDRMLGRCETLCDGRHVLYGQRRGYGQNACHVKYFAVDIICCCMGREEVMDRMLVSCEILCRGHHMLYG